MKKNNNSCGKVTMDWLVIFVCEHFILIYHESSPPDCKLAVGISIEPGSKVEAVTNWV